MKETEKQVTDAYKSLMTQSNNNLARAMNRAAAYGEQSRISRAVVKMFKDGSITKEQLKMADNMVDAGKSYDDVMSSLKPKEEPKKKGRQSKSQPEPEPEPEPVHTPKKKRGRPKKDTTHEDIQKLMHEISSTKYPKNIDIGPEPKLNNRTLTKHYAKPKAVSKSMSSHNVTTVKKSLKAKVGKLLDSVEHSDLLKYINQF